MGKPRFYDFNVHTVPDGKNTVNEVMAIAKHFGFSGIVITNHSNVEKTHIEQDMHSGVEAVKGVEIVASNPSKLHGLVGKYRKDVDVLAVHGGNEEINRAAVENPNVDILTHPQTTKNGGINHVLAKSASYNNVSIEFNLNSLIKGRGGKRVHTLSFFSKNLELARKYNVPTIITSNAHTCYELRAPREMVALAELFGMGKDEAIKSLSKVPENIILKNRENSGTVRNGVEIIKEEIISSEGE
ncbi:MAG: ribonuclease P protein component 3 [Methanohalobium sp.]|uniref:ribonuclease P protein component 3 n=1 Tax=Methanohalobium sp. TaxID=2837493 RepID=UPI003979D1EE